MSARAVTQAARSGWGPLSATEGQLTTLKWIGVAAMLVDHVGRYGFGLGLDSWAFAVGRIAFPIFASVLGLHLARYGSDQARIARTARRLALWAAISAIPSWLVRGEWLPVNVFATLALGTLCCMTGPFRGSAAKLMVLSALLMLAVFVEFSVPGVLVVWSTCVWARRPDVPARLASTIVSLFALVSINAVFGGSLAAGGTLFGYLLFSTAKRQFEVNRRSKWAFYSLYPAHLIAIFAALLSAS